MPDFYDQYTGWLPTSDAEMQRIAAEFFVPFAIRGAVERKRTTAWEVLEACGQTDQFWRFYQETGDCLHPDTIVYGDQVKRIADCEVGETVYTGQGYATTIISKQVKVVNKPLLKVTAFGRLPIEATPDHKVWAVRSVKAAGKKLTPAVARRSSKAAGRTFRRVVEAAREWIKTAQPEWIAAGDLKPGDWLLFPKVLSTADRPHLPVDGHNMDYLLGLFVADGTEHAGTISWSISESATLVKCLEITGKLGLRPTVKPDGDACWRLVVHNKKLADCFRAQFYDAGKVKQFPSWAIGNQEFLQGVIDGDGCEHGKQVVVTSTSLSVIYGVSASLAMIGIPAAIGTYPRGAGVYANAKPLYRVSWIPADRKYSKIQQFDDYFAYPIRKIEASEGPHVVLDIGVSDPHHSFIANGVAVSNCVSFGAAKAFMAVMAYEIIRQGQPEKFHPLFPPYVYAISRCMPEGGRNRLRGAGSMGAWVAATIRYGVLRADHPECPKYSGALADQWGADKGDWRRFVDIADDNQFKVMARINNADELADAICSGYFCTIAGNRQYSQTLKISGGKGWYSGGRRYAHQTSYLAFDTDPEPCFYDSNQWPGHAGNQPDGPDGGGWRSWDYVDRELRSGAVECFAASQFDGFPSDEQKPDFSMGA